jgi:DNA-binding NtrC family response regulator
MSGDRLILVVDPTEGVRELLTKALTLEGYRVETCEKGITALQKIYDGKVDLVLVDAEIEDIEIDKFVRASQKRAPRVPIIVVSANTSGEFEKQVRRSRIFYYATKPFSVEILKSVVGDALRHQRDRIVWEREELGHFRAVTRSLLADALDVLHDIKRECEDREEPEAIIEGIKTTDGPPHCGWSELKEKFHLLEHYLDYAKRFSEGKV